jgi:hypothetical protein
MTENPAKPAAETASSPPPTPIDIPADVQTRYINMVRIVHSPAEMVFDFAQFLPGDQKAKVQSRVLMSPLSAKLFYRALAENLAKYEATYGEIRIPGESTLADRLFRMGNP